jgi:hypothetical protein
MKEIKNGKPEHFLFSTQMYQMASFSCLNFRLEGISTSSEKKNIKYNNHNWHLNIAKNNTASTYKRKI